MADVGLFGILVLRLSTRKHARIVQGNATCATRHSKYTKCALKKTVPTTYILILSFPVGKWLERNYKHNLRLVMSLWGGSSSHFHVAGYLRVLNRARGRNVHLEREL